MGPPRLRCVIGGGGPAGPGAAADDRLPSALSRLVVRLEPGAPAVREPGGGLRGADGRPLSIDHGSPERPPRAAAPCRSRHESPPVAAAREVAAGDPALRR